MNNTHFMKISISVYNMRGCMYIISKVKMFSNYVERKHQSTYVTHIQTHSYSRRICIIISVVIVTRDQFIQRGGGG